ncbi:MAG TPA: hypothetical protein VII68_15775 [Casimicrobiaceae bacterium]|jgi:hypothetical protein
MRLIVAIAFALFAVAPVSAQTTLDGMPRIAQWTDLESGAGELPVNIWGVCANQRANRVGIRVDFQNGSSAFATYSGVANFWNTGDFGPVNSDSAGGFFSTCGGLHFLFTNKNVDLPMAWDNCSMPFSGNFDLDANEAFGSNFRADTAGWVSAAFQTYCGDLQGSVGIPATTPWWQAIAALSLMLLGAIALRARRVR